MNLLICGILSAAAILYCVLFDETLVFNMMMCVFCIVAIISLWSEKKEKSQDDETATTTAEEVSKED